MALSSLRRFLGSSSSSSPSLITLSSSSIRFCSSDVSTTRLFVSGLSRLTTNEKLREAFSPFGQLLEAHVASDRATGRSKGFGFVKYTTPDEAEKAREGMNAKFLDGWVIFVDPAKPRERRPPPSPEPDSSGMGFSTNRTIGCRG